MGEGAQVPGAGGGGGGGELPRGHKKLGQNDRIRWSRLVTDRIFVSRQLTCPKTYPEPLQSQQELRLGEQDLK